MIHLEVRPFFPVCGSLESEDGTTRSLKKTTCPKCLKKAMTVRLTATGMAAFKRLVGESEFLGWRNEEVFDKVVRLRGTVLELLAGSMVGEGFYGEDDEK